MTCVTYLLGALEVFSFLWQVIYIEAFTWSKMKLKNQLTTIRIAKCNETSSSCTASYYCDFFLVEIANGHPILWKLSRLSSTTELRDSGNTTQGKAGLIMRGYLNLIRILRSKVKEVLQSRFYFISEKCFRWTLTYFLIETPKNFRLVVDCRWRHIELHNEINEINESWRCWRRGQCFALCQTTDI